MDYRVHGILQARILEWVAVPFSRRSSQPNLQTQGLNPGLPHCSWILYQLSHPSFFFFFFFFLSPDVLFFSQCQYPDLHMRGKSPLLLSILLCVSKMGTYSDSGPSLPGLFLVLDLQPPGLRKCPPLRQRAGLLTVCYKTANSPSLGFSPAVMPSFRGPHLHCLWRRNRDLGN